ncbi:MAG: hypothetical protein HYZ00_09910 [Candidatus Hydrogenedentes bacterium]|nr:hypothetical protein [Candidatus Hydrogenedentota bacterium]
MKAAVSGELATRLQPSFGTKLGMQYAVPIIFIAMSGWAQLREQILSPGDDQGTAPPNTSAEWWAAVQQDIATSEYQVIWQDQTGLPGLDGAYQAPNRAQDLRTYFTEEGPWVVRRSEAEPTWVLGLEWTGYGYEDALVTLPAIEQMAAEQGRIEYRRGGVTEWYLNGPKGLEQGFTLAEAPAGGAGSSTLVLELAVRGDLAPGLMPDGKTIEFLSAGG